MTVAKVDGMAGLGGSLGGAVDDASGLFGALLAESTEELKKKQGQAVVDPGAGISILQLSSLMVPPVGSGEAVSGASSMAGGGNATDEAMKLLHEMTSDGLNGYWKWYLSQLKDQVRGDVMQSMGVTEQGLQGMPPAQRVATEKAIEDAVSKKVRELLEEQMKKAASDEGPVKKAALLAAL